MGAFPILERIFPIIGEVVDRVVPDKAGAEKAKREIEAKLVDASIRGQMGQIEVNKVEAANPSVFVSGWRPGMGWVCVAAFFIQFVFFPIFYWVFQIIAWTRCAEMCGVFPPPPMLDEMLWQVVIGMLGLAGVRTAEKWKGVAAK